MSNDRYESLTDEERDTLEKIVALKKKLDEYTQSSYNRTNPFAENLIDWHEKGEAFAGEGSVIYDSATLIGDVSIGEHAWIGEGCLVDGSGGLTLGDYVVLACGVHIYTHDTVKWALSGGQAEYRQSPVSIGSNVFIGAQSVITCGVTIGDHVLVCANSTVTGDVASNSIVAGSPARTIGEVIVDGPNVELSYY
ncbi:MAG: acyltransferase [Eggerthellaceae bacterium]|nr:acyltransferase [Eggerthellaceae bacterium]